MGLIYEHAWLNIYKIDAKSIDRYQNPASMSLLPLPPPYFLILIPNFTAKIAHHWPDIFNIRPLTAKTS